MRIAYVIGDKGIPVFGTKGASIHVREIVNAFAALGHRLTLFVIRHGHRNAPLDAEVIKITEDGRVGLESSETADKTARRELQLIQLNEALYQKLLQTHGRIPFDFIYERYALFGTAGVRASKTLNIPAVVEVNSPLVIEQQDYRTLYHIKEAEQIEQEVFNGASALCAVSDEIKHYIRSKQVDDNKIHVIPNGVDTAKFHPEVQPANPGYFQGRKIVGFVGSLKPWHGIEVLLEAFSILSSNYRRYQLLIVGDGPLGDWIGRFTRDAGIEDRVTVAGWTDHHELPGLIKSMDVAVAPYPELEHFYFSPLKLYEYMAIGIPILASKIGQIQKIINNDVNGILIEPGNPGALAIGLQTILDDTEARKRLGKAARQTAKDYTWSENAKKIIAISQDEILRPGKPKNAA